MSSRRPGPKLFVAAASAAGAVVALPIAWLILSSFRSEADIVSSPYAFSGRPTIINFAALGRTPAFWLALRNSTLIAMAATALCTLLALPIGYALGRYRFPGHAAMKRVALLAYMFAPVVAALPYTKILGWLGLIDTLPGIALAHVSFCLPFAIVLSELAFRTVPIAAEEVAMLSGAGFYKRLLRIVLPGAKYQLAAMSILVFAISWKEFFLSFIVSSGANSQTLPVLLSSALAGDVSSWHLACAMSAILSAPALIVMCAGMLFGRQLQDRGPWRLKWSA